MLPRPLRRASYGSDVAVGVVFLIAGLVILSLGIFRGKALSTTIRSPPQINAKIPETMS